MAYSWNCKIPKLILRWTCNWHCSPTDQTMAPCLYYRLIHFSRLSYYSRYSRQIFAMARVSKSQETSPSEDFDSSESESHSEKDVRADAHDPSCSKGHIPTPGLLDTFVTRKSKAGKVSSKPTPLLFHTLFSPAGQDPQEEVQGRKEEEPGTWGRRS